ncbi:peptidylprolyl isomerase [Flavobacterium okayamense]|uniref:PpiC domain-containing protein n=1 Tax=Flavobacterium okayamense TaxID=2830782 RepID=A0ABM7S6W9_9FLAO|nr:peptidylprolyl isomerase [Flavobacterium okayamense]BCY29350.1 hypothetical protein KK2020170_22180 [Flavobacterium okayamense]
MKRILTILFLITFSNMFAQDIDLSKVNSMSDAQVFIKDNPNVFAMIEYIPTTKDSIAFYKDQINIKKEREQQKFLEAKPIVEMKLNYIFFDGSQLSKDAIDVKRNEILELYKKGATSDELVAEFTMDRNVKPGGNFGWIDELGVESTFREAVKKHKKGDVFTVDVPDKNWYYIVFKLYDDIEKVALHYLKIQYF